MSYNVQREELSYEDLEYRYAKLCHNTDHPIQGIWKVKQDEEQNLISCFNIKGELIYACMPGVVPNNKGFSVGHISPKDKGTRVL